MKSIQRHHSFMWNFTKRLLISLKRPVFFYLVTLSFTLIGICSFGIYAIESTYNSNILTYMDALYYSVTVMTGVGLGDIAPVTLFGRILSMAMMLLGTAIYVCFTAVWRLPLWKWN